MTWIAVAEREAHLNAGPGIIEQLAAIARGTYTDIVDIIAPAQAASGDLVNVEARVQNLYADAIYISTSGRYDNTIFYLYPEYATVGAGATRSFSGSFTMPNKGVRVYVWSYYWNGAEWRVDDEAYVDIALAAPPVWNLLAQRSITSTIPAYI